MADSSLLEMAKAGDLPGFENACLAVLTSGNGLSELVRPFQKLERTQNADRVATLAQTILEPARVDTDPNAALAIARSALFAAPKADSLRTMVVDLYKRVYSAIPGFGSALDASGLAGDRPARAALKLLDVYLELKPGDTLIGRMDDRVVEILDIDRENGLLTLRRQDRPVQVPAAELAREYDRIDRNDFRTIRQLWPQRLAEMIENDPVGLVVGLLHSHGGSMDADQLKEELVPRVIEAKSWAKWWTNARTHLKRATHVRVEGRSPVMITLLHEPVGMDQEMWKRFSSNKDPDHWLTTIETYLKDKAAVNEPPSVDLLKRAHDEIVAYTHAIREKRPAEALSCALLLGRLAEKGMATSEESKVLAGEVLTAAKDPVLLIRNLEQDVYWSRCLEALPAARPTEWLDIYAKLLPVAPASQLDTISTALIKNDRHAALQAFIDQAYSRVLEFAEANYWLWKGPKIGKSVQAPTQVSLLRRILDTWTDLGRAAGQQTDMVKEFKNKLRSAFALRDYAMLREAIGALDEAAAITVRRQLERIDGLGDMTRMKALEILRDRHPQLWLKKAVNIAAWEDDRVIWSTQLGIERKVAERENIEHVQMRENAVRIGEAASHGDLSENSEYKFALEERDLLRARFARINEDLSKAQAIDPKGVATDVIGIGTRVTFRRSDTGKTHTMTFFGPFDTDVDRGIFSYQAPVAQKTMGKGLGEKILLALEGEEREYEVAAIENAFDDAK
ncbi:MAG: GreA/GreB family elongation factor [Phycisphaerae bacterium]|nr:GreA/GreB family elongation factor [Phycisphaerae bacterium]